LRNPNSRVEKASELRKQAEKIARATGGLEPQALEAQWPEEARRMVHELRVHQIELEMQNEELRRAQSELEASRIRYFDFFDLAPLGFITIGEKGGIQEANLSTEILLGVDRGALVNQSLTRFIHPNDQETYYFRIRNLFETGESQKFELRIQRYDKTAFWADLSVTAAQEATGAPLCRAVLNDITHRKQTEEALRNTQWRLESIIEGTRAGTWEWNIQTGETVFNETWANIVGYTLDELSPISIKSWEALAFPEDLKQSNALLARHFAGELPYYDFECRMKHKDGHWVWVHDRGRLISRTSEGRPLMMFGTHTDITARKIAESNRYS
jgi:PAS domain S-box-containing protein